MGETPLSVPSCPDHPFAGSEFVPTPETIHYGKNVCPKCGRFITWVRKPDDEKRQRRNTGKLAKNLESAGIEYCQICLRKRDELPRNVSFVAHHVIEVQDGGTDDPANLWHLCSICHEFVHLMRRNRGDPRDRPGTKSKEVGHESQDCVQPDTVHRKTGQEFELGAIQQQFQKRRAGVD